MPNTSHQIRIWPQERSHQILRVGQPLVPSQAYYQISAGHNGEYPWLEDADFDLYLAYETAPGFFEVFYFDREPDGTTFPWQYSGDVFPNCIDDPSNLESTEWFDYFPGVNLFNPGRFKAWLHQADCSPIVNDPDLSFSYLRLFNTGPGPLVVNGVIVNEGASFSVPVAYAGYGPKGSAVSFMPSDGTLNVTKDVPSSGVQVPGIAIDDKCCCPPQKLYGKGCTTCSFPCIVLKPCPDNVALAMQVSFSGVGVLDPPICEDCEDLNGTHILEWGEPSWCNWRKQVSYPAPGPGDPIICGYFIEVHYETAYMDAYCYIRYQNEFLRNWDTQIHWRKLSSEVNGADCTSFDDVLPLYEITGFPDPAYPGVPQHACEALMDSVSDFTLRCLP